MSLVQKAKQHLADNRMTFLEHLQFAGGHGLRCLKAGCMLLIHGILPCFFRRAGSRLVHELSRDFTEHRLMR